MSCKKNSHKKIKGQGILLNSIGAIYSNLVGDWVNGYKKRKQEQNEEIERLKRLRGGTFEGRDIIDFFAGPVGWVMMGKRKQRDKQIEKLRNQTIEGSGKNPKIPKLPLPTSPSSKSKNEQKIPEFLKPDEKTNKLFLKNLIFLIKTFSGKKDPHH